MTADSWQDTGPTQFAPSNLPPMQPVHHRTPWQWVAAIVATIVIALVGLGYLNDAIDGTVDVASETRVALDPFGAASAEIPAGWSYNTDDVLGIGAVLRAAGLRIEAGAGFWYGDSDDLVDRFFDDYALNYGFTRAADAAPSDVGFATHPDVDARLFAGAAGESLYLFHYQETGDVLILIVDPGDMQIGLA